MKRPRPGLAICWAPIATDADTTTWRLAVLSPDGPAPPEQARPVLERWRDGAPWHGAVLLEGR